MAEESNLFAFIPIGVAALALARLHPEYCAQFCSSYLRKDVVALEAVQRRFTRLIPEMRGLSYEERLNSLGRYSLEFRRMRGRSN